jgi:hypothetical protein
MGPHLPLTELAMWTAAAFSLWLVLTTILVRLGSPIPALVGALISWPLARLLLSGWPDLVRWAADVLNMTG